MNALVAINNSLCGFTQLVNRMERGSPEPNEADFQDWVLDDDPAEPAERELETSSAPCVPAPVPISSTSEQGLARSQVTSQHEPVSCITSRLVMQVPPPNRLAAEGPPNGTACWTTFCQDRGPSVRKSCSCHVSI